MPRSMRCVPTLPSSPISRRSMPSSSGHLLLRHRNKRVADAQLTAARRRNTALFVNFFRRELTTRYLGSTTGLLWALLHPLALLGVYHFVFTTVFRTRGFGDQSFLLFVAVALWPWLAAQEGLQRATVSLAN